MSSLFVELTRLQNLYRTERDLRITHTRKIDEQINIKMTGLIADILKESLQVQYKSRKFKYADTLEQIDKELKDMEAKLDLHDKC